MELGAILFKPHLLPEVLLNHPFSVTNVSGQYS